VLGVWRKPHNKVPRNLYSSPSIIRINKSRRMRLAWHVARMGRRGTRIGYWWENQRERDHCKDPGIREGILLKIYFRKRGWGGMYWVDLALFGDQRRALVYTVMWRSCNRISSSRASSGSFRKQAYLCLSRIIYMNVLCLIFYCTIF
jgi:hypothetical protein